MSGGEDESNEERRKERKRKEGEWRNTKEMNIQRNTKEY